MIMNWEGTGMLILGWNVRKQGFVGMEKNAQKNVVFGS